MISESASNAAQEIKLSMLSEIFFFSLSIDSPKLTLYNMI